MLTLGQACCLVLDMEPTQENRKEAKKLVEESIFSVAYRYGTSSMEPLSMGKTVIKKNPFKYKVYAATPPSSPKLLPDAIDQNDEVEALKIDERSVTTATTRSSQEIILNYGKNNVISLAKIIFFAADPESSDLYSFGYFSNKEIYEALKKHFPSLSDHHSFQKVANWIDEERAHFGPLKIRRDNNIAKKGRFLWACKEAVADILTEKVSFFRSHCEAAKGEWVNIGYLRKSCTHETNDNRVRLLKVMIARLVSRSLCTKLFASPSSALSTQLLDRDYPKPRSILKKLDGCDGDTQDLFSFLSTCTKKVRFCILDYAGLSNDPRDVENFLKLHKNIKELVIDHGSSLELLDRHSLLHGEKQVKKFKSRFAPVRRSQM